LFHVLDTGIGIPVDKREFVFDRFFRIDTVVSKNYVGGTGLGLPIVKGLTGLLGGKVWLESECDKGSTFYFTIDYKKADVFNPMSVEAIDNEQNIAPKRNLLIVEDDECNAMYLQEILKGYFSNIYVAETGQDAIKLVQEHAFDIVLMDVRLPDITGYEATNTILKQYPTLKIIAQTAYAANDERYKAIEAGCIDYVSKPTKREELLAMIGKYLK
jgi:CheY-like chemotaxis protein